MISKALDNVTRDNYTNGGIVYKKKAINELCSCIVTNFSEHIIFQSANLPHCTECSQRIQLSEHEKKGNQQPQSPSIRTANLVR